MELLEIIFQELMETKTELNSYYTIPPKSSDSMELLLPPLIFCIIAITQKVLEAWSSGFEH